MYKLAINVQVELVKIWANGELICLNESYTLSLYCIVYYHIVLSSYLLNTRVQSYFLPMLNFRSRLCFELCVELESKNKNSFIYFISIFWVISPTAATPENNLFSNQGVMIYLPSKFILKKTISNKEVSSLPLYFK